ncbi:translation elongation factor 4 [Myxococcota bacterium]|nr:translation elongation factor 4 [Myxococcota bacterium]MBU1430237.1 translation elongation factor 4 [Myxococcota bacterium]MBU1898347.1 translation elongation factor 4 [Myxococcota bacterium]
MPKKVRNFAIIAHIDHGKSTLADRILSLTGSVSDRDHREQFLDSMDLERERGITIKSQAVRLPWRGEDGELYEFNLIDTPGHVDFTYEVSRSLAACEGVILVVDASQGVEAQTLANVYLALDNELEIIPVLNKVDLPAANPQRVRDEIEEIIGLDASEALEISAKSGLNVPAVLQSIIDHIPPPADNSHLPLRALIFDSWYDNYRGVIVLVRVVDGEITRGSTIYMKATQKRFEVLEVGVFAPAPKAIASLTSGDVGFVVANIKEVRDAQVGDTIVDAALRDELEPLAGFKEAAPVVFSGLFPVISSDYEDLREALHKLRLNDAAFSFEPETSAALGFGFRCGFLGLLHLEIVQERLEREFNMDLITTAPTVIYEVERTDGEIVHVDNPALLPDIAEIRAIAEPYIHATIHVPTEYAGPVLKLCEERRGLQTSLDYAGPKRMMIHYDLPLSEVVFDFFDKLKTITRGYGSFEYEMAGYRTDKLIKLDIRLNGEPVDALSVIVHKDRAYQRGKTLCERLRKVINRQQYDVAIQAAIGNQIISRQTVKALRKDVTAKCYGGDISRKRKLLEKQKAGKKRMKQVGNVEIPQEAFRAILEVD